MTKVGIAVTPAGFNFNDFFGALARNYAAAFRRLGFVPVFVELGKDPVAALDAPDIAFVFSHSGWVLAEPGYTAARPLVMLLADPPFLPWISDRLTQLPAATALFVIDRGFLPDMAGWLGARPAAEYLPCAYAPDGVRDEPCEKTIEVLFVGALRNPAGLTDGFHPNFRRAIGEMVESALFAPDQPFLALARPVLAARGQDLSLDNRVHRDLLLYADRIVRCERRARIVRQLLDHPVTFVTDNLSDAAPRHPNARLLPPQSLPGTLDLLRRSKLTVVCQPNFSHAVNERIVFALQSRCGVVTTANARLPEVLGGQPAVVTLSPRLDDVAECLERARATIDQSALDRAFAWVARERTPDANARLFVETLAARGWLAG